MRRAAKFHGLNPRARPRREWAHRRHRRSDDGDGLKVAVAVAALDDGEEFVASHLGADPDVHPAYMAAY